MDGGPFRAQRPADRRATHRPDPAYRRPEEPQPVKEAPPTVHRTAAPQRSAKDDKPPKRFVWPIITAFLIVVLGVAGWFVWSTMHGAAAAIDGSKYQAVLLTNGESYFGKLAPLNGKFMKLTDVYYLKAQSTDEDKTENSQQQTTDDSSFQLIKFGGEVQGPEDEILISKDQIVYYENLRPDGKATQAIEQYKKSN